MLTHSALPAQSLDVSDSIILKTSGAALRYFLMVVLSVAAVQAQAQAMYADDLLQLSGVLRSLMVRAERLPASDREGAFAVRSEALEVQTKLYRISEEAASANLALAKTGNSSDRHLLLVVATAESLALAKNLTISYLDTRDKVFWTTAQSAAATARNLQAAMK